MDYDCIVIGGGAKVCTALSGVDKVISKAWRTIKDNEINNARQL